FSANSRFLTAGDKRHPPGEPCPVRVWEIATGKEVATVEPLQNNYLSVALSADGKLLATGGQYSGRGAGKSEDERKRSQTVQLWDVTTGKEIRKLKIEGFPLAGLAFSPDGKTLTAASSGSGLTVWGVTTGKAVGHIADGSSGLALLGYS